MTKTRWLVTLAVLCLLVAAVAVWRPSLSVLFSGVGTAAIVGYGFTWLAARSSRSAATRQFYDTLRTQLTGNESILKKAHDLAAKVTEPGVGFGPGFVIPTPYLSAWDLLVGLAGAHHVPPHLVSEVATLHRKFDNIARWQDYLAEVYLSGVQQQHPAAVEALRGMYVQAVTGLDVLASEAENMVGSLRALMPDAGEPKQKKPVGRVLLSVVAALCLLAVGAVGYEAGKAKRAVPVQEVVRANRFEVMDGEGRVRAIVGMSGMDPVVYLMGREGKLRADLSMALDGSMSMKLRDRDGMSRAVLEGPGLARREGGKWEMLAEPSLALLDAKGKVLWQAP